MESNTTLIKKNKKHGEKSKMHLHYLMLEPF